MKIARSITTYLRTEECRQAVLKDMPLIKQKIEKNLTRKDIKIFFQVVTASIEKAFSEKKIKPEQHLLFIRDNYFLKEKLLKNPKMVKKIIINLLNLKEKDTFKLDYFA